MVDSSSSTELESLCRCFNGGNVNRRLKSTIAPMKIRFVACVFAVGCLTFIANAAPATQPSEQWTPLFNGKDLTGWYTFLKGVGKNADPQHVFQVHDGIVHIYND